MTDAEIVAALRARGFAVGAYGCQECLGPDGCVFCEREIDTEPHAPDCLWLSIETKP